MEEQAKVLKHSLATLITTGLIAGAVAAVINIVYMYIYESMGSFDSTYINVYRVALASLIPCIFSGILLFIIYRLVKENAFKVFVGAVAFLTLVSLALPYSIKVSEVAAQNSGIMALTIPMHLVVGLVTILSFIIANKRKSKRIN